MFTSAVIDAVEDVDVALHAAQFLFSLTCRIDEVRFIDAQAVNKAVTVILAAIELHEVDNALNDLRSQGIGIAAPRFQQDGQRFLVNLSADTLELRKSGIDADDAANSSAALKADMKPGFLGCFVKLA